ncbi:unnamed protein product [Victoria cruziana]
MVAWPTSWCSIGMA